MSLCLSRARLLQPWEATGSGIDARAPQFVLQPPKEETKQDEGKKDAATKK